VTDDEARALLAGIDGPRPLPPSLRHELGGVLADEGPWREADTARPLPDDLRRRLEATLLTAAPRPVPRALRRRILRATGDRLPALTRAAAVLVLLVGAAFALGRVGDRGARDDLAQPGPSSSTTETPQGVTRPSLADGRQNREVSQTAVLGAADSPAVVAFEAYLSGTTAYATAGRSAGEAKVDAGAGAAGITVNLSPVSLGAHGTELAFETVFVRTADLTGRTISVGLPVEDQARLAVAQAYPRRSSGGAVVVASRGEPWASAARAFEAALRGRGVEPRRITYGGGAPRGAPAVFLALSPADVRSYLGARPTAPSRGIHAIASAYDDALAQPGLTVLSPFAPPGGAEEARLRAVLPDGRLTAEAIHGWVTAKVVAELLRRTAGAPPTAAEVAALDGWSPGWGVVVGRPGAYRLRVDDARLSVVGRFLPASPDR